MQNIELDNRMYVLYNESIKKERGKPVKDWKKQTVEDLKRYRLLRASLKTLPGRVRLLEESVHDRPAAAQEVEKLARGMELARRQCDAIDCGLACLSEDEQRVLTRFFIDREPGCAGILCEELGCEQAQVYRVRERALQKMTLAMYGPAE